MADFRGWAVAALLVLLGAGPAAAQAPCPTDFEGQAAPVTCLCSAQQAAAGTVWGTRIYTTDSGVCRAAVHAGAIPPSGGAITVTPAPGRNAYEGSTGNGVQTSNYGPWARSFTVVPAKPSDSAATPACPANFEGQTAALSCRCAASATGGAAPVWGAGVYTTDSSVCRAALHAGIIPPAGGTVNVMPAPGRQSYQGGVANGVQSAPYGPWTSSFVFKP